MTKPTSREWFKEERSSEGSLLWIFSAWIPILKVFKVFICLSASHCVICFLQMILFMYWLFFTSFPSCMSSIFARSSENGLSIRPIGCPAIKYFHTFFCIDYEPPMDLGILVDSSSAVDWSKMQSLLKGYVGTRNISFDGDHVGIVYFASSGQVALPFPTSSSINYNKNRIWQAINDLKQQGGDDRRIDLGLETVATDLFGPRSGARRDANQVKIPLFCPTFLLHVPLFRLARLYLTISVLSLIVDSSVVFRKFDTFVYSFQTCAYVDTTLLPSTIDTVIIVTICSPIYLLLFTSYSLSYMLTMGCC